jgi:hypothetical protein
MLFLKYRHECWYTYAHYSYQSAHYSYKRILETEKDIWGDEATAFFFLK